MTRVSVRLGFVINQRYGRFRINISDTSYEFSSIIRGLINVIQHHSTFRKVETLGAGQVQRTLYNRTEKNKVCFYNHISEHSTTEKVLHLLDSIQLIPQSTTAQLTWMFVKCRTSVGSSKQALGSYISKCHFMNANPKSNTLQCFHMNYQHQ